MNESSMGPEDSSPFGSASVPGGPGAFVGGIRWGRIVIITIAVLFASAAGAVGYFGV